MQLKKGHKIRWGNCLLAALRKRRKHNGAFIMMWWPNQILPHFHIKDFDSRTLFGIQHLKWPGTIRFLGDEHAHPSLLQALFFPYYDVEVPFNRLGKRNSQECK